MPPLNANAGFEFGTNNWAAVGGAQAIDTVVKRTGRRSILLTPDGVSAIPRIESTPNVVVLPSKQYRIGGWLFNAAGIAGGVSLRVNWFQSGGAFSATSVNNLVLGAGVWQNYTYLATSPVDAGLASIHAAILGTPLASVTLNIDDIELRDPLNTPSLDQAMFEWFTANTGTTAYKTVNGKMFAFFSTRSGLSPQLFSLSDHMLAYYRAQTGLTVGSLTDVEEAFWTLLNSTNNVGSWADRARKFYG